VLREALGYDDARLAALRAAGALGPAPAGTAKGASA
jgi:hypothetical protein